MERWHNKVAVVTGASRGIGDLTAKALLKEGLIVVGLARRDVRMQINMRHLSENLKCNFYPIKCDVRVESEVVKAFKWIDENLGGTDILVNSAGILHFSDTIDTNTSIIKDTLNTNVMGVFYCIREAFASMRKRNFDGHIVCMSSAYNRIIPPFSKDFPTDNVYFASKAAVNAMAETFRQEFAEAGNKTKVTTISPGGCRSALIPEETFEIPLLQPENCTEAILYVLGTPSHVEVQDIIIKPVGSLY